MLSLWTLILKNWKTLLPYVAVLVLAASLMGACHAHDNAVRSAQQSADRAAALATQLAARDDMIVSLHERLADVSAEFVPESVFVTRWAVKHDTLEQWRHDTITVNGVPSFPVPVATVDKDDAGKQACSDLLNTCSAFKRTATRIMAIQDSTIHDLKTHPLVIQTSCKAHDAVSFLLGAGAGAGAVSLFHR